MAIAEHYRVNFETLRAAASNGDLCLLEAYDRISGKPAVMLCAAWQDGETGEVHLVPFAQMCEGNPYEKYVMEREDVAKYYAIGESVARTADRSFLDTIKDVPYVEEDLAKGYAILKDHLNDHERAMSLTLQFVEEVLSRIGGSDGGSAGESAWSMSAKELDSWIEHAENPGDNDSNGNKKQGND